jgi:hypothetical protein
MRVDLISHAVLPVDEPQVRLHYQFWYGKLDLAGLFRYMRAHVFY